MFKYLGTLKKEKLWPYLLSFNIYKVVKLKQNFNLKIKEKS